MQLRLRSSVLVPAQSCPSILGQPGSPLHHRVPFTWHACPRTQATLSSWDSGKMERVGIIGAGELCLAQRASAGSRRCCHSVQNIRPSALWSRLGPHHGGGGTGIRRSLIYLFTAFPQDPCQLKGMSANLMHTHVSPRKTSCVVSAAHWFQYDCFSDVLSLCKLYNNVNFSAQHSS